MNLEKIYLSLKHWQLFLMFFLTMFLMQLAMIPTIIFSKNFKFLFLFAGGLAGISFLIFYGWFYFIIKGLNDKINNENLKIYKNYYLFFLFFPVIYIATTFTVLPQGFTVSTKESTIGASWLFFVLPAHFFSMFSIFYLMYKAAKTIKTVELQKRVTFGDFAGEFFLLWFSPIGIWILQPKINKFVE